MRLTRLRTLAAERANGECDLCGDKGTGMARLHAIGEFNGLPPDDLGNVLWCCGRHVRWCTGECEQDEVEEFVVWHEALLGERWCRLIGPGLAFRRVKALTSVLEAKYGEVGDG